MGLIKAAMRSAGGVLADQWKEFFYCEALPDNVLVTKGQKRTSGRSSNRKGSDNIISSGSVIAVADGQCMLVVEQGKVVEVAAEPGEFIFDSSTEPTIFAGDLGEGVVNTFKAIAKRIEKRVTTELEKMRDNDRAAYETFFENFGRGLKFGIYSSYGMKADELGAHLKIASLFHHTASSLKF